MFSWKKKNDSKKVEEVNPNPVAHKSDYVAPGDYASYSDDEKAMLRKLGQVSGVILKHICFTLDNDLGENGKVYLKPKNFESFDMFVEHYKEVLKEEPIYVSLISVLADGSFRARIWHSSMITVFTKESEDISDISDNGIEDKYVVTETRYYTPPMTIIKDAYGNVLYDNSEKVDVRTVPYVDPIIAKKEKIFENNKKRVTENLSSNQILIDGKVVVGIESADDQSDTDAVGSAYDMVMGAMEWWHKLSAKEAITMSKAHCKSYDGLKFVSTLNIIDMYNKNS